MLCPWDRFAPATLEFCESLLNGWVRQPANTWSNVGFLIVGVLIWQRTLAIKPWLRIFAVGSILIGFTSGFFHLSMTFAAQFFDVSSMFLTAGMLVVLNTVRLKWIKPTQIYKVLISMQIFAMLMMLIFQGGVGEIVFAAQIFFLVLSEIYLISKERPTLQSYRWWVAAAASYGVATIVWILDIKKMWCNPENHIFNGHATWHLLNAVVVWCMFKFYDEVIHVE